MRAPGRRRACSRSSRRWTSSPSRSAWTRSSCASATSPTRDPERDVPWSSRHLVECLRTGAERFGWAGRDLRPRHAHRGPLAGRHRGRGGDLPDPAAQGGVPDLRRRRGPLPRRDRRLRHRHRRVDGADADRRRRAGGADGRRRPAHRRQPAAEGRRRRRVDRAGLLGLGDRAHRRATCAGGSPTSSADRCRPTGSASTAGSTATSPTRGDALDARVRRALRRGAGRLRHRRGAGAAGDQRVRRRDDRERRRRRARSSSAASAWASRWPCTRRR